MFKRGQSRYEGIRQIYLEKGMDPDWVHKRIDGFIDKDLEMLYRGIVCEYQRCYMENKRSLANSNGER